MPARSSPGPASGWWATRGTTRDRRAAPLARGSELPTPGTAPTGHGGIPTCADSEDDTCRPHHQLGAQLLLDRGEIDPGALLADQAIAEVEDVQEAGVHRSALSVHAERVPHRGGVQDGLVDDVVGAVPTVDGFEAIDPQVSEERAVELLDLCRTVQRRAG